ncbi:MAG TPA: hypothetical protein VLK85_34635 [Ramlibacter sp.]|nr:hypothetical protein [Ramlibacter sp.]
MAEASRLDRVAVSARTEAVAVTLLAWAALALFTWSAGGAHLSWDALNHHIYLGWIADHPRFGRDFMPAGYQSFQYPYLYWPVYKLAALGAGPQWTGFVLVSLSALAVPAVWMIARACIPGRDLGAALLRAAGLALAFLGCAVLSLLDVTSNDLLAGVPLVWAIAMAVRAVMPEVSEGQARRAIGWSGFLAGMAVAFKFSNGPIAILLPLLWVFGAARRPSGRALHVVVGGVWTLAGLVLAYGYWGWLLWDNFGNPLYPFAEDWFAPLRAALGHAG